MINLQFHGIIDNKNNTIADYKYINYILKNDFDENRLFVTTMFPGSGGIFSKDYRLSELICMLEEHDMQEVFITISKSAEDFYTR